MDDVHKKVQAPLPTNWDSLSRTGDCTIEKRYISRSLYILGTVAIDLYKLFWRGLLFIDDHN